MLFIFMLSALAGFSQKPDTAFISASISYSKQLYHTRMKGEWPLNSGGQYIAYASIEGEHPYFIKAWSNGSVQYLDDVYDNVLLLLDLRGDRLIMQHPLYDINIELSPQKVKSFALAGHWFINLRQDSIKTLPESGYYDILQSGTVSVIAKRKKTIKRTLSSGKTVAILKESNLYYLLKDAKTIQVKSGKSILNALGDLPDLKRQLKKNKVKFGQNREAGLAETVRIYNELVKVQ
ncbi:MAG: hypothetical protein H7Y03_01015 [Chitinophagaceae bacterium]|nr:hypothetical protein [Chitinophagaceae bacterium]